ncbi:MAG: hypothetical protein HY981_00075 [Candidatus Magasanikbacteria bacterium]|nr:hypothetical protein [Candidatus Magasanikbacteria bacterium]
MRRIFFSACMLSLALVILQQAANTLFAWRTLSLTEVSLVILIFMIALGVEHRLILLSACLTGITLDLWSASGFGTIALALTLTTYMSIHIFHRMLTNKSLSALLILGIISTIMFRTLIFLFNIFQFLKEPHLIGRALIDSGMRGGLQIIAHSMIFLLLFAWSRLFSRRLHPHYVHPS